LTAFRVERTGWDSWGSGLSLGGLGSGGSGGLCRCLGGLFGRLVALLLEGGLELSLEVVKGVKSCYRVRNRYHKVGVGLESEDCRK
jgi:hypothetical protein